MNSAERIAENLTAIRQRIDQAAVRSGRLATDVQLIAVTKYVDLSIAELVVQAGCRQLGESRPQQLWEKAEAIKSANVCWHLIGHLQRNKIRRTLPYSSLIHSIDSAATLQTINRIACELDITSDVLLEVNVSGDEAKDGLAPHEVETILVSARDLSSVAVRGLMTMAALDGSKEIARKNFAHLRDLRERLLPNCPENVSLHELSMGMSEDFEVAIEEGATLVRVGSALFEGLN